MRSLRPLLAALSLPTLVWVGVVMARLPARERVMRGQSARGELLAASAAPRADFCAVHPEATGPSAHSDGASAVPASGTTAPAPIARHVIIVSEDGLRPDALERAPAPFHRWLMEQGAYSLHAQTIRHASTLPSHAAMLSGFDVHDHGLHWNSWQPHRGFIKVPTVLDSAMEAGKGAAAFVGKKKLAHIIRPGVVDVFARPGYLCRKIVDAAAEYFLEHRPQVEFVHFSDPDSTGHKAGWMSDTQLRGVRASDRCLEKLVEAVAASPLAKDTVIIVSSDHGGLGHSHSGRHPEDRTIPWLVWGAGVRQGHRIQSEVTTVDTAATTLWALGLEPPPGLQGRPVKEAFLAAY